MEVLPIELRRNIIEHLELSSLKAFRLTSKSWAILGAEYLVLPNFCTLPHRSDIDRLIAISQHPTFNHRIKELHMNHGEVNEYHARHNTYFLQYTVDPESRSEHLTSTWSLYADLKARKDQNLPDSCNTQVLTRAFAGLPNLRAISVTLMTCPFQGEDDPELLKDIWRIPSTRLLPRVATTERFTNILTSVASNLSTLSLESLSHDRLPFEFFAQKSILISLLSTTFQSLTTLNLALDYSDMPNNLHILQAFQNLSHCLRSATLLKRLSFAMLGRRKIDIGPLLLSFEHNRHVFAHLEQLTLKGVIATEETLVNFLTKQNCLKRLQLGGIGVTQKHQPPNGGIHLSEGTFKGLFAQVASRLDLESFLVQGDLVGLESGERWILEILEDYSRLWEYVMD